VSEPDALPAIDTSVAHPARRYNYWLGGTENFPVDRESGDAIAAAFPTVRTLAVENRKFLRRAVDHLVRERGIRQFLDIGTGIPSADNTPEVAQAIAPHTRVVYVDNDPIVGVHAQKLLTGKATAYVDADLREPRTILARAAETLDFSQPVGLMLLAVLHFLHDADDPYAIVATLLDALAPGSYLTLSHGTADFITAEQRQAVSSADSRAKNPAQVRSKAEIARFFTGLELVDPGLVSVADWRSEREEGAHPSAVEVSCYGGMGEARHNRPHNRIKQ
jgi:hypothetical protein